MIKIIKNIVNLTKILFQNSTAPYLIDKKNHKINKKSMLLWLLVIIMIAIIFISQYLIKILIHVNQLPLFLNFMLLVLMVVLIFQIILVCVNVYYFSKDLELLLPLPIKSEDLLIAKLNTIILSTYFLVTKM